MDAQKLVIALVVLVGELNADSVSTLKCSGPLSKYTDADCQQRGNVPGCYYTPGLFMYFSCAEVCNNVIIGSRDAERCNVFCPRYTKTACHISAQTLSTESQAITMSIFFASTANKSAASSHLTLVVTCGGVILIGLTIILFVGIVYTFKRRQKRTKTATAKEDSLCRTCFADLENQRNFKADQVYRKLTMPVYSSPIPASGEYQLEKAKLHVPTE
ncbi:uncharacterized protein [Watersipora subatra]|uniref:uncharacterized protein n=1 Tax=Watersipora subatra TaxID=2589382 RepID=UPI00355C6CB0